MIDERIAERRAEVRELKRRVRLRRTIAVVVLLLLAVLLVVIERSPLVALEEVRVVGTERLEPDTVIEAAGLSVGTSTLRLRLNAAEQRVADLPLVRQADARRADPLTVEISVVERLPVLTATGEEASVLVDRDGVVIDGGEAPDLPEIRLSEAPPSVGRLVAEDPALANAYRVWRGLSGPLRAEVAWYEARGVDELSLHLSRGIEVRFGRAQRVDEKVRALGAILDDLESDPQVAGDVAVIDVRAPAAPVVIGR